MLYAYENWPGLEQVCCVTRTRKLKGVTEREVHYYITSLSPEQANARDLLALIRKHWDVENGLHYVRDTTFREDHCRVRTGSGPRVFAEMRNAVIALLRSEGHANIAAAVEDLQSHPPTAVRLILCEEN